MVHYSRYYTPCNTEIYLEAKVDDRILPCVCLGVPGFNVFHLQVPEVLLGHIALDQLARGTRCHHFRYDFLEIIVVRVGNSDLVLSTEIYNFYIICQTIIIYPPLSQGKGHQELHRWVMII